MTFWKSPYKSASLAYFLYGCIYLATALEGMTPARREIFLGLPWWAYFLMGVVVLLVFPILIWREYRWFTRILVLGPFGQACVLLWKKSHLFIIQPLQALLFLLALFASFMLARAGWDYGCRQKEDPSGNC